MFPSGAKYIWVRYIVLSYLLFPANFSSYLDFVQIAKQHGVYLSDWIGSRERSRFSEKGDNVKPHKEKVGDSYLGTSSFLFLHSRSILTGRNTKTELVKPYHDGWKSLVKSKKIPYTKMVHIISGFIKIYIEIHWEEDAVSLWYIILEGK